MKLDFPKQNKTHISIKKQDPTWVLADMHNANNKSKYLWKSRSLTLRLVTYIFINAQAVFMYIKIYDSMNTSNHHCVNNRILINASYIFMWHKF